MGPLGTGDTSGGAVDRVAPGGDGTGRAGVGDRRSDGADADGTGSAGRDRTGDGADDAGTGTGGCEWCPDDASAGTETAIPATTAAPPRVAARSLPRTMFSFAYGARTAPLAP